MANPNDPNPDYKIPWYANVGLILLFSTGFIVVILVGWILGSGIQSLIAGF